MQKKGNWLEQIVGECQVSFVEKSYCTKLIQTGYCNIMAGGFQYSKICGKEDKKAVRTTRQTYTWTKCVVMRVIIIIISLSVAAYTFH